MSLNDINTFFTTYEATIVGLCAILGVIGGVVGFLSTIFCKKAEEKIRVSARKIEEYEVKISKLETENAQIAKVINNYGLSYDDTKSVAGDVFEEKTKNISNLYCQDEEPENIKDNDVWISGSVVADFGCEDKN